jgi:hypothetical protein
VLKPGAFQLWGGPWTRPTVTAEELLLPSPGRLSRNVSDKCARFLGGVKGTVPAAPPLPPSPLEPPPPFPPVTKDAPASLLRATT